MLGNHDRHRTPAQWRSLGFAEAVPWPLVWEGFFLLSHEPLYVNRNMPYANVFGHVHGNPAYRDVSPRSVCVSVERTASRLSPPGNCGSGCKTSKAYKTPFEVLV